eukprot:m.230375 g.230375  ORF g.230375 m.230375 type:complete len:99 (-) comp17353_c0_seq23:3567-3863(-)
MDEHTTVDALRYICHVWLTVYPSLEHRQSPFEVSCHQLQRAPDMLKCETCLSLDASKLSPMLTTSTVMTGNDTTAQWLNLLLGPIRRLKSIAIHGPRQ